MPTCTDCKQEFDWRGGWSLRCFPCSQIHVVTIGRAHAELNREVRAGRLIRQPCEVCGSTHRVEGHHEDYSRPLDIRWLCQRHHKQRHVELRHHHRLHHTAGVAP